MSHLGGRVDELQVDAFQGGALAVHQQRLAQGDNALLRSDAAALDHQEVVVDLSVMRESAHGVDGLVSQIVLGGRVVLDDLQGKKGEESLQIVHIKVTFAGFCYLQAYHLKFHV